MVVGCIGFCILVRVFFVFVSFWLAFQSVSERVVWMCKWAYFVVMMIIGGVVGAFGCGCGVVWLDGGGPAGMCAWEVVGSVRWV